ncbi:Hypothetical protein PBC10988_34100 [Planctomycetales bacterium 10988]|nr:Hypothetical protein PBC10988_34100 [Planctomycetales bacterium 10988]
MSNPPPVASNPTFDPYQHWLGIPPEERPAHFYRLLGLPLLESNPQAISSAADHWLNFFSSVQGEYAPPAQYLYQEILQAKTALLDPNYKPQYDTWLRQAYPQYFNEAPARTPPPASSSPSSTSSVSQKKSQSPPTTSLPQKSPAAAKSKENATPRRRKASTKKKSSTLLPGASAPKSTGLPQPSSPKQSSQVAAKKKAPLAAPGAGLLPNAAKPTPTGALPTPQAPSAVPPQEDLFADRKPAANPFVVASEEDSSAALSARKRSQGDWTRWLFSPISIGLAVGALLVGFLFSGMLFSDEETEVAENNPEGLLNPSQEELNAIELEEAASDKEEETSEEENTSNRPERSSLRPDGSGEMISAFSSDRPEPEPEETPDPMENPDSPLPSNFAMPGNSPNSMASPSSMTPAEPAAPEFSAEEDRKEQDEALKQVLTFARLALAEREFEVVPVYLEEASLYASTPEQQDEVARVDELFQYVEVFWQSVTEGCASLQPGATIYIDGKKATVVSASDSSIEIEQDGRPRRFGSLTHPQVPVPLILTLAEQYLSDDAENLIFFGAFHAMDRHGDRQEARLIWEEAQQRGDDRVKTIIQQIIGELDIPRP